MSAAQLSIYREVYQSQLGPFELRIESTSELYQVKMSNAGLETVGHNILMRRMYPPTEWLPSMYNIETATAWIFHITKRNSSQEQLTCRIETVRSALQGGSETGENLIAIGFEDGVRQLHIGTEDEDAMACRANCNDWMPPRLKPLLSSYYLPITEASASGLKTTIPILQPGEQFYFHYIVAENPYRTSLDYPDEPDISTWYAVNQQKHQLEKLWQVEIQKPRP